MYFIQKNDRDIATPCTGWFYVCPVSIFLVLFAQTNSGTGGATAMVISDFG